MKDTLHAKIAFYLSLGFWVPLFNIGLCITSIIIAVMAINNQRKKPEIYGGLKYAIFAMVISFSSIILTITGLIIYLTSEQFCGSSVCELYNSQIALK